MAHAVSCDYGLSRAVWAVIVAGMVSVNVLAFVVYAFCSESCLRSCLKGAKERLGRKEDDYVSPLEEMKTLAAQGTNGGGGAGGGYAGGGGLKQRTRGTSAIMLSEKGP